MGIDSTLFESQTKVTEATASALRWRRRHRPRLSWLCENHQRCSMEWFPPQRSCTVTGSHARERSPSTQGSTDLSQYSGSGRSADLRMATSLEINEGELSQHFSTISCSSSDQPIGAASEALMKGSTLCTTQSRAQVPVRSGLMDPITMMRAIHDKHSRAMRSDRFSGQVHYSASSPSMATTSRFETDRMRRCITAAQILPERDR